MGEKKEATLYLHVEDDDVQIFLTGDKKDIAAAIASVIVSSDDCESFSVFKNGLIAAKLYLEQQDDKKF